MSELVDSIQEELRKLGFRTDYFGDDFSVYTELFVNDVYRIERIKRHLHKEPTPDAVVVVDFGANKNWFLHLLRGRAELDKFHNVLYFRIEPQPISVSYPVGDPSWVYHINRAVVPNAEDGARFFGFSYNLDVTTFAGSAAADPESRVRVGSEVPQPIVNDKHLASLVAWMNVASKTSATIYVERIGVGRLLDIITKELEVKQVEHHRALIKVDCEYKELTVVSDVLAYISANERWEDFLLVAETAAGGTFDPKHRERFAVEEYMELTGVPDDWLLKLPYMIVQSKAP